MTLHAAIGVTRGALRIDVEITVEPGDVVALLGPNGAGKSSVLRCIAGLTPIDDGHIVLERPAGRLTLDHPAQSVFVPPERRPVGVVFQNYLLFEHLSALENVAFGLRARGVARAEARATAADWLDRVGLADHARHRPSQLSGGQAQRVALARALATEPEILLLDEPLAALDAGARRDVRRDLRLHLTGFSGVRLLVTHDPVDAFALADHVVVMEGGVVAQHGALAEVTARPRSRYVAELIGINLVGGEARDGVITTAHGTRIVPADTADGPALTAIRPQSIALHRHHPEGSPRNLWHGEVAEIDRFAERVRVRLAPPLDLVAEITPAALTELGLRTGDQVWASVKASEVLAYPR